MNSTAPVEATTFKNSAEEDRLSAKLVAAFREISVATVGALELDRELNQILTSLTEQLGFDFAVVCLVDEYRKVVEAVRGKNVPLGMRDLFRCSLDSEYILASIVRRGQLEVIHGWDDRLKPEIYHRFGYSECVRLFAPIMAKGNVVGVIWAGCPKDDEKKVFTPSKIDSVRQLGISRGEAFAKCRPHVLLEVIAQHAIRIIDADSASIHVYQTSFLGRETLLEATAGKATRDFLHQYPPSANGIGAKAMESLQPQWIDNPDQLRAAHDGLHGQGIRAFAAFPLALGADVRGVLYVHFWKPHQITQTELELEGAFAKQMEVAIKNSQLMRDVADYADKAWMTSGLQKTINSLASGSTFPQVAHDIATNVLYMLGADNLTLYPFYQNESRFHFPPIVVGTFNGGGPMIRNKVEPGDVMWEIIRGKLSLFVSDVSTDLMLAECSKRRA